MSCVFYGENTLDKSLFKTAYDYSLPCYVIYYKFNARSHKCQLRNLNLKY